LKLPGLWYQLSIQRRVIRALMIREVIAVYGRNGLGAGWVIGEPLTFALPVLLLWSIVRSPFEHGIPMVAFLWTGYLPILLFRHVGGRMLWFIRHNSGLMYHRNVTILDIFIARCAIEVAANLGSAAVVFVMFYMLGEIDVPRDLPTLIIGYLYMIWWCATVGLIIGAMCERSEWVEKIWSPYSYTYLFYSGFFFMAAWLPPALRNIALYQPSLQAYEMIRAGMFGNQVHTYYDFGYTSFVLSCLTVFGLLLMRAGRLYVTVDS